MSLEKYLQHSAARIKVTLPCAWGSERKVAYFTIEQDLATDMPTADSTKFALNQLIDQIQEVATRRAPAPSLAAPKKSYCKICAENGFPNIEITWPKVYSPTNKPLELDGKTLHVHKQKAA